MVTNVRSVSRVFEVLRVAARLGVTSFGGPVAHLGYFHEEYVVRRKWLDEPTYADLVALCQFLPGPASSQLGISIGLLRAGFWGAMAAWAGFTLPSAALMIAFAAFVSRGNPGQLSWLHGLALVAVAVVAQAIWTMAKKLTPDGSRAAIAVAAGLMMLLWQTPFAQMSVLIVAALVGTAAFGDGIPEQRDTQRPPVRHATALVFISLFFVLLFGLPLLTWLLRSPNGVIAVISAFYRSGALVFGGGHVVLPLLQSAVVPPGWIRTHEFVDGYGAAQAVPGPLFTFSSYLGYLLRTPVHGVVGGLVTLVAIYVPSFLLVLGVLPYWNALRTNLRFRGAMMGLNAAVVGILGAAFITPVLTTGVRSISDGIIAVLGFVALVRFSAPPWIVVVATVLAAAVV